MTSRTFAIMLGQPLMKSLGDGYVTCGDGFGNYMLPKFEVIDPILGPRGTIITRTAEEYSMVVKDISVEPVFSANYPNFGATVSYQVFHCNIAGRITLPLLPVQEVDSLLGYHSDDFDWLLVNFLQQSFC